MADPTFPPLLTGHGVKSPADHFERAVAGASAGEFGAGDCIWSRNTQRFDCAIVLEPDVGVAPACQMLHVAMVAFGDAFGALAPPEVAAMYRWPGLLRINGATAGHVRLAISRGRDGNDCPDWMVVDIGVQMGRRPGIVNPGEQPEFTDFVEEGCGEITRSEMIESYSRHFLTWLHTWQEDGFAPVHRAWTERAEDKDEEVALSYDGKTVTGKFLGLDEAGDLLLKCSDETRLFSVPAAMGIDAT